MDSNEYSRSLQWQIISGQEWKFRVLEYMPPESTLATFFFLFFFFWYCNELIVRSFADKWQCITGKDVKQAAYKVLSTIVVFYIVTGLVVCSDTAPKYNSKNYRKSQNALSSENPVNKNQVVQWGVWSSTAFDGVAGFVLVNLNFSSS